MPYAVGCAAVLPYNAAPAGPYTAPAQVPGAKRAVSTERIRRGERRAARRQRRPADPAVAHTPVDPRGRKHRARDPRPVCLELNPPTIVERKPAPLQRALPVPSGVGQQPLTVGAVWHEVGTDLL